MNRLEVMELLRELLDKVQDSYYSRDTLADIIDSKLRELDNRRLL